MDVLLSEGSQKFFKDHLKIHHGHFNILKTSRSKLQGMVLCGIVTLGNCYSVALFAKNFPARSLASSILLLDWTLQDKECPNL